MLRLVVVLLVLANLGFYAWTQGWMDGVVGVPAQGDREPERLTRQVRPETVHLISPPASGAAAATLPAADMATVACLEAGPYTGAQIGAAEGVVQTVLPAGSWISVKTDTAAVWIVYMGTYPTRDAMQRKAEELRQLKIAYEELRNLPELDDGLALGRFNNRAAADKALAELAQRGVRTARVVMLSPPGTQHRLRVERADGTLQTRLNGLRADALLGKPFAPCPARP